MTKIAHILTAYATAAVLMGLGAGCASKKEKVDDGTRPGEQFSESGEVTDLHRITDRQIAAGARTDATIRPYHFREADLNSLGREKIDLMLKDSADAGDKTVTVVYVDVPSGGDYKALADARFEAVTKYLGGLGLPEGSYRVERGFNPNETTSAGFAKPAKDAKPAELGAGQSFTVSERQFAPGLDK